MSITINLYYTGKNGAAQKFVQEMISSGTVQKIKEEAGNLRYDYFIKTDDPETILLIDCWESQQALDLHHASPMMDKIAQLRNKYNLVMHAERYVLDKTNVDDDKFIRR